MLKPLLCAADMFLKKDAVRCTLHAVDMLIDIQSTVQT